MSMASMRETVERDYVLAHVLTVLGPLPNTQNMIFKGGTALRMCYFEAYRYSADLDFSLINGMTIATALTTVRAALDATKELIGFPILVLTEDGKHIEYVGPLRRQRDVKLDLADDELVEDTATRPLFPCYPDQAIVTIAQAGLPQPAWRSSRTLFACRLPAVPSIASSAAIPTATSRPTSGPRSCSR